MEHPDSRQLLTESFRRILMAGRKRQKIVVARHDVCGSSGDGQFNELLVARITLKSKIRPHPAEIFADVPQAPKDQFHGFGRDVAMASDYKIAAEDRDVFRNH
jgi:hypothetical protein